MKRTSIQVLMSNVIINFNTETSIIKVFIYRGDSESSRGDYYRLFSCSTHNTVWNWQTTVQIQTTVRAWRKMIVINKKNKNKNKHILFIEHRLWLSRILKTRCVFIWLNQLQKLYFQIKTLLVTSDLRCFTVATNITRIGIFAAEN